MSEEKRRTPDPAASDPEKPPSPADEVPPGTHGAGEDVCPRCGGRGRLESGEECPTCYGTGVVLRAVGGGG
jgi:hypothetical protein